jgi:hypothetical protein
MKRILLKAMAASAGIILASSAGVSGAVLYQNTATPSGSVLNFPNNQQVGEQIWLGTLVPQYLTNFSFEYYSPFISYTGPVQMDVRLYQNNGALFNGYASPGATPFFDSGNFSLTDPWQVNGTNTATVIFQLSDLLAGNTINLNPTFVLPTNFTFTVTISGLQGLDQVGLPFFGLNGVATVGTNAGDYWYNNSGTWQLLTNSSGSTAFGAQFLGKPTPEPSVLCLGALGMAALTVVARRRNRRV